MKKLFIIMLMLVIAISSMAQTFKAPKSKSKTQVVDSNTTYKYEIKDTTYTVYKSPRGAYYIWKRSKNGGEYKMYLPKETQIQMGRVYKKEK